MPNGEFSASLKVPVQSSFGNKTVGVTESKGKLGAQPITIRPIPSISDILIAYVYQHSKNN